MSESTVIARFRVLGYGPFKSSLQDAARQLDSLKTVGAGAVGTMATIFAGTLAASAAGLAGLGVASSKAAADMEALRLGLGAVLGSAEAARLEWLRLADIAKLPGLGMREAAEGVTRLMSAGLGLEQSERVLKSFGNALATVGGGKEDLSGIILALSQMQSKGKVFAEEINQINERVPQIRKAMQAVFGTADTEVLQGMGLSSDQFIAGITSYFEQLPQVVGGAKNAMENFSDAFQRALDIAGSVINQTFVPALNSVSDLLNFLSSSGVVQNFAKGWMDAGRAIAQTLFGEQNIEKFVFRAIAVLEQVPHVFKIVFTEAIKFVRWAGEEFDKFIDRITFVPNTLIRAANAIGGLFGFQSKIPKVSEMFAGVRNLPFTAAKTFSDLADPLGNLSGDMISRRASDLQKAYHASQKGGQKPPTVDEVLSAGRHDLSPVNPVWSAIEQNTRRTAEGVSKMAEIRRYAAGGGERARIGLTPVEVRQIRVEAGGRALNDALASLFMEWLVQMRRQGLA